ncbi:maleylpyruvate isomerase family mycothiol-dependent enzyme [Streptomyces rectiverticillatus]|uniref:maleylpyruvate isomerase family mycothiol-dependent enzyme n=1 Tax=Streptomyces rectiverticillatus TaxID=173860 RepID=UPI0015C3B11E|nr:maleylpyruvate isomerase family mycothiol-dependent enzyme [Streptomyces rectiverticillatus]QLE72890.1 maleylpyruvate isomerase family mycothiol-dependent enzyme [Streptomyces rectiverticillatus]
MTVHPNLQPAIDAWTHSIEAINDLVKPLAESDWNRATECPGWSVRDVVSHVIGVETEMLGEPRPMHTLPRDLFHVTDEFSRYNEVQVDVRRCHTALEMTSELELIVIRRSRQLRNESRGPQTAIRWPLGSGNEQPLERALVVRAFDVWTHEQDLRRALGMPGNLDSPAAVICRDFLLGALPKVVAKDAGAPPGSAVVFDVHGPLEFLRTVRVDAQGRGKIDSSVSLGPTVTFGMDWETYARLACGRVHPEAAAGRIKVEGDAELAEAVLREFAITP